MRVLVSEEEPDSEVAEPAEDVVPEGFIVLDTVADEDQIEERRDLKAQVIEDVLDEVLSVIGIGATREEVRDVGGQEGFGAVDYDFV